MSDMKFWINTVSKDHLQRGIAGGFMQANHGKPQALRRLSVGDYIVVYSPKTAYDGGEQLQSFTALARVTGEEVYQFQMSENFIPFRRDVVFLDAKEAPIRPLIYRLEFIQDKQKWGFKFRFGMFEINKHDFDIICQAMHAKLV